jgi:hypothetical protein
LVFLRLSLATIILPVQASVLGVVASILVAAFSWRYVEKPFRARILFSRPQVLTYAACASIAVVGLGGMIKSSGGAAWRFDAKTLYYAAAAEDYDPLQKTCPPTSFDEHCLFGGQDGAPASYAVWGDSFSSAMRPAIAIAMGSKRRGVLFWNTGCAPLLGLRDNHTAGLGICIRFNDNVVARMAQAGELLTDVFLVGRWPYWSEGTLPRTGGSQFDTIEDSDTKKEGIEENHRVLRRSLLRVVEKLQGLGKHVTIIGPVPEHRVDIPKLLALTHRWARPTNYFLPVERYRERNLFVSPMLKDIALETGARFVDLESLFCRNGSCNILYEDKPLYFNADHLSYAGARNFVGPYLANLLAPKDAAP